eukprot:TRINITY_DN1707_c1_g1_i1.p1 TRINITY_DN1707_c1_g1~~TRINITY_DN1707_c1_g1_i1.p1  ORF type:complete len:1038 (+),score=476.38 TRINITY_DN1707_c1_g1_i1:42-3155(+)
MAAPSAALQQAVQERTRGDVGSLGDDALASLLRWLGGEIKKLTESTVVNPVGDVDLVFEATADALAVLIHKAGSTGSAVLNGALDAFLDDMSYACNVPTGADDHVLAKTIELVHEVILLVTPSPNAEENVIENYDNITADTAAGIVAMALMVSNPRPGAELMLDIAEKIHSLGEERPSLKPELIELVEEMNETSEAKGLKDPKVRVAYKQLMGILRGAEEGAAGGESRKRALSSDDEGETRAAKRARQESPPKAKEFDLDLPEGALLTRADMDKYIMEALGHARFYAMEGGGQGDDDDDDDDIYDKELQAMHIQGLEQNITDAARAEQIAEIKKANDEAGGKGLLLVEGEGEIATEGLLSHADSKDTALRLARAEMKDRLKELKAVAIDSIANTSTTLRTEGLGAQKHGMALLSRLVAQSGDEDIIDAVVGICVRKSKAQLGQSTDFALHLLYSFYATLAPFHFADDPIMQQGDFDEVAASPDPPLDLDDPTGWLGPVAPADGADPPPPNESTTTKAFLFRDAVEEKREGDAAPTPLPTAALDRYNKLFEKILGAFASHLTFEVEQKHPLIADVLVQSPSLPWNIWHVLNEQFCESGDRVKTWVGFEALTEILRKRPAARLRALSLLLKHTLCEKEMVRAVAVSFLVTQAIPADAELKETATAFAKRAVEAALSLHDKTAKAAEKKGASQARIQATLTLLFALCLMHEELFEYVFDIYKRLGGDEKMKERRSIISHPDLARLIKRLGHEKLIDCIKRRQGDPLLLHMIGVMIAHEKKELEENLKNRYIADQIEQELVDIEEAVVDAYKATGDKRMVVLLLSLTPRDIIKDKVVPEVLVSCRPEHVSIAMKEAVTPLPHHYDRGVGLSPVEMLLYLHQLTPGDGKSAPTMKQIVIAIDKCILQHRDVYKDSDVARALQQLVTLETLPPMLMRTILQTCSSYPNLLSFVLGSLVPVLFRRKLWDDKQQLLWRGFIKFIQDHQPMTLDVLLSLPQEVLLSMLSGRTQLLRCFVRYLNQNKLIHGGLLSTLEEKFAGISHV